MLGRCIVLFCMGIMLGSKMKVVEGAEESKGEEK